MAGISDNLHSFLANETNPFLERLKRASENACVFWDDRQKKPNLGMEAFKAFLIGLQGKIQPLMMERKSKNGKHGLTGQDKVFSFEATLDIVGVKRTYYCKGFFFHKNNLCGVEIQSFRIV